MYGRSTGLPESVGLHVDYGYPPLRWLIRTGLAISLLSTYSLASRVLAHDDPDDEVVVAVLVGYACVLIALGAIVEIPDYVPATPYAVIGMLGRANIIAGAAFVGIAVPNPALVSADKIIDRAGAIILGGDGLLLFPLTSAIAGGSILVLHALLLLCHVRRPARGLRDHAASALAIGMTLFAASSATAGLSALVAARARCTSASLPGTRASSAFLVATVVACHALVLGVASGQGLTAVISRVRIDVAGTEKPRLVAAIVAFALSLGTALSLGAGAASAEGCVATSARLVNALGSVACVGMLSGCASFAVSVWLALAAMRGGQPANVSGKAHDD